MTMPSIPGYEIGARLGEGASAQVFSARHLASGTQVALKVVWPKDLRARQAFDAEVLAMARLNHPHVVIVHDVGTAVDAGRDLVWLAMELATGGTYQHWVPGSWSQVVPVLEAVGAGLAHAHARGVIHRDLKPSNLLRATRDDARPGPKIADFGMTVLRDLGAVHPRGGTPLYMPPEQIDAERGPVGAWSDLYALGNTIWEWLCGSTPFQGTVPDLVRQQVFCTPPAFRPRFAVPDGIEELLRSMMEKRPEDRPRSVSAVQRALGRDATDVHARLSAVPSSSAALRVPGIGVDLLPLRTPHTIERHPQRALLTATLQQVVDDGRPQVRILRGPRGVGRRHLVRWLAEAASEAGVAEVLWNPTDLSEARSAANAVPVVLAFEDFDDRVDELLAAVAFSGLPMFALVPGDQESEVDALGAVPGFDIIEVGALPDHAIRSLLHTDFGLDEGLAMRMTPHCEGVAGRAVRWLSELVAQELLVAGPSGFDTIGVLGSPPAMDQARAYGRALAGLDHDSLRALQAAAWCGSGVPRARWTAMAAAMQASPDRANIAMLQRQGLVRVGPQGALEFRSEQLMEALRASTTPDHSRAMAAAAAAEDDTPARRLLRVRLLLAADEPVSARTVLLRDVQPSGDLDTEEMVRRALERIRLHLDGASRTELVVFQMLDLRTTINLAAMSAAEPRARALHQSMGAGSPLEPELQERALAMVAQVYATLGLVADAMPLLDELPETSENLRSRGLAWRAVGRFDDAIAWLERAVAVAESPEERGVAHNALGATSGVAGRMDEAATHFALAARLSRPAVRPIAEANLALALLCASRPDEALEPARQAYWHAARRGAATAATSCLTYALAAALTDSLELDPIAPQALYSLARWKVGEPDLLLGLTRCPSVDRPESAAFLDEVERLMEARAVEADGSQQDRHSSGGS